MASLGGMTANAGLTPQNMSKLPTSTSISTELSMPLSCSPMNTFDSPPASSFSPPGLASPGSASSLSLLGSPYTRNNSLASIPIIWDGSTESEEADDALGLGLAREDSPEKSDTLVEDFPPARKHQSMDSSRSQFTVSAYVTRDSIDDRSSQSSSEDRLDRNGIQRAKVFSRKRASTLEKITDDVPFGNLQFGSAPCQTPAQAALFAPDYSLAARNSYHTASNSSYSSHSSHSRPATAETGRTSVSTRPFLPAVRPLSRPTSYAELSDQDESVYSNEIPFSTVITLLFDQEGWRESRVVFRMSHRDAETGDLEYCPEPPVELPFNAAKLQSAPVLRRVLVGDKDNITRQASLSIRQNGEWNVCGREAKGRWIFTYKIDDRRKSTGKPRMGEKNLTPLRFTCSAEVLDPSRHIGMYQKIGRAITPKLSATRLKPTRVEPGPPTESKKTLNNSRSMAALRSAPLIDVALHPQHFPQSHHKRPDFRNGSEPAIYARPSTASAVIYHSKSIDASMFRTPPRPSTSAAPHFPFKRPSTATTWQKSAQSPLSPAELYRNQVMVTPRPSTAGPSFAETSPFTPATIKSRTRAVSRSQVDRMHEELDKTPPRNSSLSASRPNTAQTLRARAGSAL